MVHQHRLDPPAAGEREEPLDGRPGVGGEFALDAERRGEGGLGREPLAQRGRENLQLGRVGELRVEALPQLARPETGQVGKERADPVAVEVVAAHRAGSIRTR